MKRRKPSSIFILGLASALVVGAALGLAFDVLNSTIFSLLSTFAAVAAVGFIMTTLYYSILRPRLAEASVRTLLTEIKNSEGRVHETRDSASLWLISDIQMIEKQATDLLQRVGSSPPRHGFLALRSSLIDLGFWTEEDVRRFDEALRVRNALVHGDTGEEVSVNNVLSAAETTSELLTKLRSINTEAQ